ncbi:VWFA and cache domain-containing protein 1-like [Oculina patagonica]
MIEATMDPRKVRIRKKNFVMLLLYFCVIVLSQVDASLVNPSRIGMELQTFARDALGVDEMQNYFDSLQYQKRTIKGEDITPQLAVKLSNKFEARFQVAKRLKKAVEDSYTRSANAAPKTECCNVNKSTLKYDERFHSKVDLENVCLKISGSASPNPVHLDENVLKEMKDISRTYPFIKWQYFGSEEGVMTNFPVFDDKEECDKYDPRYRPFYVETATPEAKDVVLVIDTSQSMIGDKLYNAKEAAKTVLDTLNPKDQVGIVSFNNEASTPGDVGGKLSRCYSEQLALAIPTNIRGMKSYVDGLVPEGQTQYRLGFEKAFSLLKGSISSQSEKTKKRVILFMTDGKPSDPKVELIFETIRDRNFELNNSVIILTYGFGDVDPEILEDIAKQNTAKYNVTANTSVGDITPGKYTFVADVKNLRSKMATYYNFFALGEQDSPVVSVPYLDAFGTGLLMSITLPCFHEGKFIGVAGTDINIDDLLSDITFFNQGQSTYAFMVSNSGRTLIHPLLPAPTDAYGDPVFLDIRTLEAEIAFEEVFDAITKGQSGSKTFVAKRFLPRGGKEKEGVTVKEVNSTYFWRPLVKIDFSVGVVVPVSHVDDQLNSLKIPDGYKFKYHRIDLNPPEKPCSHFGVYAAKDSTVVKFAPGAYKDPYNYIGKDETKGDVDLLTAYMKDDTGRVKNPGLKDDIRDTVVATWKAEDLWLRDKTDLTEYVVWRYIGTANGIFRTTPGSVNTKGYDPRQRPWYYTALAHTGSLTLTTPYLDMAGAGVVITAGRALFRGEPSHIHHTNDEVLGVMGADFPLTYFYRLLTKVYPKCKETKTYSCFVMDSAGFLIMHEDFLLPSAAASDVEYVHITEKDKFMAEDLIREGYLLKKECRDLEEIQKQSFYEVHLPPGGVDTLRSGARCTKYQLAEIIGTNAYIGIAVRELFCSAEACPCSSNNTCPYTGLTCECPCTSPLDFHYCRSQFPNSSLPICPPSAPEVQPPSNHSSPVPKKKCSDPLSKLEKCFDPRCSERNSSQTCEGIVGCYWCRNDKDDVPLKEPYCASSEVCFRGREVCNYVNATGTVYSTTLNATSTVHSTTMKTTSTVHSTTMKTTSTVHSTTMKATSAGLGLAASSGATLLVLALTMLV